MRVKKIIFVFCLWSLVFSLIGCDAFVRKFTRKRKKEELPKEELVLVPEEYKPNMSKEEMYRQYFLYWQSWQDEMMESLLSNTNHKKQVDCAQQALKNLMQLRPLLKVEKQVKLDVYLKQLIDLKAAITQDVYSNNKDSNHAAAEILKRRIMRDFSFSKVKDSLI